MPTARTGMAQRQGANSPGNGRVEPPSEPGAVIGAGSGSAAPGISSSVVRDVAKLCLRCGRALTSKQKGQKYCSRDCAKGSRIFDPRDMCGARTNERFKGGAPCRAGKGEGTRHVGYGTCDLHFGNTATAEAHAEKERESFEQAKAFAELQKLIARSKNALAYLAIPEDLDPDESLLEAHRVAVWTERGLREMVRSRESLFGPDHLGDMRVDVVKDMHREALAERARIAKLCIDAHLETRMVEIADRQADLFEEALDAALAAAGVTEPARINAANAAITRILTPARPGVAELN